MPLNAEPGTDSVQFSKQKSEVARHHINEQSQKIDSDISITSHMHTSCCMLRRAMCKCVQACNSHIATKWQLFITHATISRFLLFLGRVGVAEASAGRCSTGGDVIFHSSAPADSGSLPSSVSGVSATGTSCGMTKY